LSIVVPEEVCKFAYTGFPELLNGTTLTLHEKVVAMGEYVYVGNPSEIFYQGNPVSLIFVIDNSSSKWQHIPPGTTDRWGSRFTVTTALIDSLKRLSPNSEIGVSIYDSDLYFEPGDDQIFSDCPGETNGYIPLLKLNGNFDSDALGQATGYEILKHYLDTMSRMDALSGAFLGLKYKAGGGGTNITAGFNAAKHGMESAANPKQNQFILYLSDGVSNGGTDEYVAGVNVPTTFTVFLLGPGMNDAPQQIKTMINNIKTNDYSITNPK
ncbi:MAG: VWA domain-containing protein, partial [Planctomycetes bacterium]|nr:VWA domain-containing protein [Planctomycetota bacterium]